MNINKNIIIRLSISCLLISSILFWIYNSFVNSSIWSIHIYTGKNAYDFIPHPLIQSTPVLTADNVIDVPARFVADPFMINNNSKWYMFFEVYNTASKKGEIGLASSNDGLTWQYEQIILKEPFHLSYPYIFEWNKSYYMIPESGKADAIKLYKATNFPTQWTCINDIIIGSYADPSIVYKNNMWWLFALNDFNELDLFYSVNLTGPWTKHPASPIIAGDMNIARPGGRVLVNDDKIIRYAQDCDPEYGNAVRAFEVDIITTTTYKDHEIMKSPILAASGSGWNSAGMHQIDPHKLTETKWIACVDGHRVEVIFNLKLGAKQMLRQSKQIIKKAIGYQRKPNNANSTPNESPIPR